ncbi:MAG: methylglyoxal synthase [Hyphomicrobiales bacterium]|nr:MAG: methylglyoxal synthase [Hyphomicrobiales bacterium]
MHLMKTLALVAHDKKKDALITLVKRHKKTLSAYKLVATGTTGGRIREACPELDISTVKSGPLGGDQQIGALIAEGKVHGLIFYLDPLTPMPHDVDVKALMRLSAVYNIPMALNEATAEHLLSGTSFA